MSVRAMDDSLQSLFKPTDMPTDLKLLILSSRVDQLSHMKDIAFMNHSLFTTVI